MSSSNAKYQAFDQTDTSEDEAEHILMGLFKAQPPQRGYSVTTAAVFIISYMAGVGVLSLPHGLAETGWYGLALVALACVNSWYSALVLGRSWIIMEERWEEYRGKYRTPYPAMGLRALGPWMRYAVTVTFDITLIGIGVVYLLLSAQVAQSMTRGSILSIDYGCWILVLAAVLCPLTWFGSLEDFWFAGIGALVTAVLACCALFAGVLLKMGEGLEARFDRPTFSSSSLAFGTILFSFGGVYFFPSIQNDMAQRGQFNRASVIGFAGLLLLYLPVTIAGYAILGSTVPSNVLLVIPDGYLRMFIEICLAGHLLLAFLLVLNPVAQEAEEALNVQASFNYKRCIIRTAIVILVTLTAYTIPHFDKIMNLIGGSTMTLLTFVFPPLFYVCLSYSESKLQPNRRISVCEMAFLIQIMVIGIAGGISCTYFALKDIVFIFSKEGQDSLNYTTTFHG